MSGRALRLFMSCEMATLGRPIFCSIIHNYTLIDAAEWRATIHQSDRHAVARVYPPEATLELLESQRVIGGSALVTEGLECLHVLART